MYVEDLGTGDPVLLAHAGVTDSRVWDLAVPALREAGFRTIRFDAPGFGRSRRPQGPHSLVADALDVLDSAGVASAHWVGLSQGGATGVDLALAAPDRVRSLTLVAPGMSGYRWPSYDYGQAVEDAYGRGEAETVAKAILRRWGPMSFGADGEVIEELASKVVLDQAEWFMQDDPEIDEPSALDRLGDLRIPTLVILGDRDEQTITDIGRLYHNAIPGARLEVLEADHLLPLRVPDRFHQLLLEHLTT